jgi:membrane protein implicated in regulation of membrane protease activity
MKISTQSLVPSFLMAGISAVVAIMTGVAWLGEPLRLVQLVTLFGLSATAGVLWDQAVSRARERRLDARRR